MISSKMLEVGKADRQTRIMLAGMVKPTEVVGNPDSAWAKFTKDGSRNYTVHMYDGPREIETVSFSNQLLAKQLVIDWACERLGVREKLPLEDRRKTLATLT